MSMTQTDLNRAVSRATGESIATVRRIGFLISEPDDDRTEEPDDEHFGPSALDWDAVETVRYGRHPRECSTLFPAA